MLQHANICKYLVLGFAALSAFCGYKLWEMDNQYKMAAAVSDKMAPYKPAPAEPPGSISDRGAPGAPAPEDPPEGHAAAVANLSLVKAQQEINSDIVGWIAIPGTMVDYPVVQGNSDDYYLHRDIYRNLAPAGSIFLESGSRPDFSGRYAIVYGHSMKNGSMFGSLLKYAGAMYFENHPVGALYYGDQTCGLQIFASLVIDADDPVIYGSITSDKEQDEFLAYAKANARQYRSIPISHADRILALSTCAYDFSGARMVVLARMPNA